MQMVIASSPLSTHHLGVGTKTGWLRIRIMCPSDTCLYSFQYNLAVVHQDFLFYLFLECVQINCIFSDNVHIVCMYLHIFYTLLILDHGIYANVNDSHQLQHMYLRHTFLHFNLEKVNSDGIWIADIGTYNLCGEA